MDVIFDMNTKFEDIMLALTNSRGLFIARFITGETIAFDTSKTSDNIIIRIIENKISAIKEALSEMTAAAAEIEENDDERYDAMYQAWLAEQDYRYDAEDAVLHHYV